MPDTTPLYGLHMPNDTDSLAAAVKDIPRQLAADVESTVAALTDTPAPGAWTDLAPAAGWGVDAPNGFAYRKVAGIVYLTVNVTKANFAAGEVVGVLPVGFRPTRPGAKPWRFAGTSSGSGNIISVSSTGQISAALAGVTYLVGSTSFPV